MLAYACTGQRAGRPGAAAITAATLAPIATPSIQGVIDAIDTGHTLRDWQRDELLSVLYTASDTLEEFCNSPDWKGRYDEAVKDLADAERDFQRQYDQQNAGHTSEINDLQAALDDARARVDTLEAAAAETRLVPGATELEWLRRDYDASRATIATLRAIIAQQADMIATLRQHLPARIKAKLATV